MIRDLLYTSDPYAEVRHDPLPPDLQGWNGDSPILAAMAKDIAPALVIEVGSWKGQSALTFARSGAREVVCVDTWLGGLDHMQRHAEELPALHRQFLSNMVRSGVDAVVTPLRQTSAIAARFLASHGVTADLVYVDASHDYPDVCADLAAYWPLVRRGGWMIGDDYADWWKGVVQAVDDFSRSRSDISVRRIAAPFWMLSKL